MAYATIADFQARYDVRLIAQLSDDGNSGVVNSANIQPLLEDGKYEIITSCLRGSIYTAAQLDALVASGDTVLVRLNCDLALKMLVSRRVGGIPTALTAIVKAADEFLDALRSGKRVLNIDLARAADTPGIVTTTGLQRHNLGDLTQNEFWSNCRGTNTTNGPGV